MSDARQNKYLIFKMLQLNLHLSVNWPYQHLQKYLLKFTTNLKAGNTENVQYPLGF